MPTHQAMSASRRRVRPPLRPKGGRVARSRQGPGRRGLPRPKPRALARHEGIKRLSRHMLSPSGLRYSTSTCPPQIARSDKPKLRGKRGESRARARRRHSKASSRSASTARSRFARWGKGAHQHLEDGHMAHLGVYHQRPKHRNAPPGQSQNDTPSDTASKPHGPRLCIAFDTFERSHPNRAKFVDTCGRYRPEVSERYKIA